MQHKMFRASSCPSSGATTTAVPEADTAVVVAPDNGHEEIRNILSCI